MNLTDLKQEWIAARRHKSKAAVHSLLLPLSPGHTGLVLASGALDGRIVLADGRPVVIKGVASKSEYEKSSEPGERGYVAAEALSKETLIEVPGLWSGVRGSDGEVLWPTMQQEALGVEDATKSVQEVWCRVQASEGEG